MSEFKDKIRAAGGKVEFLYDPAQGIASQISGFGFMAMYLVAVSMDGRRLLATVPATGIGQVAVYPKPSLLTYIQSDEQGMWGRNCPACQKYFRTNHVVGVTFCPYCALAEDGLAFVSKEQRIYITAYYDAFARAYLEKKSTSLDMADITDDVPAWHYAEVKQQFHFKCETKECKVETDILGEYGFCPRCGLTNARKLFAERIQKMLKRMEETKKAFPENTPSHRNARREVWEELCKASLSDFESLGRHVRNRLLCFPMTRNRRNRVEELNFQNPLQADEDLKKWFDIGLIEWIGDENTPARKIPDADLLFVKKMVQKRHILMHNGGIVDEDYLKFSGDTQVVLGERISVSSKETRHFIECLRALGTNLMDNSEFGFKEG